jgi:hypothetical protein
MKTNSTDIYTFAGDPVTTAVHQTGRLSAIVITATGVEDPEDDATQPHTCPCGDVHLLGLEVIELAPDKAVQLAHEIIRLATPLI